MTGERIFGNGKAASVGMKGGGSFGCKRTRQTKRHSPDPTATEKERKERRSKGVVKATRTRMKECRHSYRGSER